MRVYAYAAVTIAAGVVGVATLTVDGDSPAWEQVATLTTDAAPAAIARPRAGTVQEAGIEIRVGGVALSPDVLRGPWEVSRNRRSAVQGGHFGVALSEWGTSPLGDPFAALGSPTGIQEIEYWGCYRDDETGAVYKLSLLPRTIADTPTRDSGDGGHIESYETLDPGARWPRVPVTMTLPPGHGLTTGRITEKLLRLAGETRFALEQGRRRLKEFQIIDGDAVAMAQEQNDVEGRVLRWDRYGNAVNPTLKPASYAAPYAIDEDDILSATVVRVVFPPDAITQVTATGTAQVYSEEDICGDVAAPDVLVSVNKRFAPFNAAGLQGGDCGITPLDTSEEAVDQLFTLTITRSVARCGTLRHEESEQWAYCDPEAARRLFSGGSPACVAGVYLPPGATDAADDGSPAYVTRRAFWAMVGRSVRDHYYDAPGWTGPLVVDASGANDLHFQGSAAGEWTGRRLGSIARGESYYNPRRAAKVQPTEPHVPFEELDFADGYALGNGEAVRDSRQTFMETSFEIELVRSSAASGYLESVNLLTKGWAVVPNGNRCQFSDGALSEDDVETFGYVADELTSYGFTPAENMHTETVSVARLGEALEGPRTTTSGGAPPPVEYLPGYEPYDATAFIDATDAESAVTATPGETRPIKVTVSAPDLLPMHLPRIVKASFPYAEDEDELYAAAVSMIRESLVIRASLELSANFLIAEGQPMLVTHRPSGLGVARPMVLNAITWQGAPDQPITASLDLELYPVE